MKLKFTKMHGAGNDFIFVNKMQGGPALTPEVARKLSDRRFGIGCDQILTVEPSTKADFKMQIINADGTTVEMCGNGIRCFSKYVLDNKLTTNTKLTVETLGGMIRPEVMDNHPQTTKDTIWVKVDMGEPVLEGRKIPVNADGQIINYPLTIHDQRSAIPDPRVTCVSMGNPHAVIFVEDVKNFPVTTLGPLIENDSFFPNRTNVEFVQVVDKTHALMRVWERGTGETLACGTGACGGAVACMLHQKTEQKMTMQLTGGSLEIEWNSGDNHVYMTGPATTVFEGKIDI